MKKIAIAMLGQRIAPAFSRADALWVYTVDGDTIEQTIVPLAEGGTLASVQVLASQQVHTLICGDLSFTARSALSMLEIEMIPGCTGDAPHALQTYLNGQTQGDPAILQAEIPEDPNDPLQCMHDCAKCSGCGDPELVAQLQNHLPKDATN